MGRELPDFFLSFFFSCSADHERDWPPCKVIFFGLATNALNVRNNGNNNNNNSSQSFFFVKGTCKMQNMHHAIRSSSAKTADCINHEMLMARDQ